jgi:sugar lactone lactonase YvrE
MRVFFKKLYSIYSMKHNLIKSLAFLGQKLLTGLLITLGTQVHGQIINTYAGNGTATYAGDNGQATAASLNQSTGVAIDATGNIYIADSQNYAVRKVDAKTGVITTVAGNGINANSILMDGIAATSSELSDPWGVAVDDSGNIYIADYGDKAIRKVTASTGIITTIAGNGTWSFSGDGGPATAATLSVCIGVALDDSGNVYIADQWNHRIRKVTKKTGIINTIAGSGTEGYSGNGGQATNAELAYPSGMVIDDSGNVYIADQWNNEIRKVSQKTGIITDFAGNGNGAPGLYSGGYSGDGGQATSAQLNYATGVGMDDSGNIYIADWANQVVRKVTLKTGIITTVAGNNAKGAGFYGDGGQATSAQLNAPSGVTTDVCGDIYIADYMNNRIRQVSVPDTLKVSPNVSICRGGNDTLKASGGINYIWSPSAGLSDTTGSIVVASPTATTTYTLTGNGGCGGGTTTTLSIVVTVTSSPVVSVQPDSPLVCKGQQLTLYASGGISFQWVGTTDTTDSIIVNPSRDTTYELLAVNGTCITDTFISVKINLAPPLIFEPPSPSTCSGAGIVLSVPASGNNYVWTPASTLSSSAGDTVTATPSITTTYTVIGIDSLGCTVTGLDTVSVKQGPSKPTISQSGDVLTSSATQGNQWVRNDTILTGATNQTYTATISGYYQVIAKNPVNGCSTESDSLIVEGINQLSVISEQLSVYPNPTGGEIFVNISSSVADVKDWNLQITDVLGRTLYTKQSLNYNNDIDLSSLPGGVYFITVINKTGRAVVPVVKQNY